MKKFFDEPFLKVVFFDYNRILMSTSAEEEEELIDENIDPNVQ